MQLATQMTDVKRGAGASDLRKNTYVPVGIAGVGVPMPFQRNTEIFGEEETADYLYMVVEGAVRTYKVLNDGRRQISAFYLPGDIFGLEVGKEHTCSAEAISDSSIVLMRRSTLLALAEKDGDVARKLWEVAVQELGRAHDHALLLIKSAQERIVAFLLEMAERLHDATSFQLPMSRQDIADYLGLTIETVSRSFTQLEAASAIELPASRHIILRNRFALSRLNA